MPKITSDDTTSRDIKPYARAEYSDSDISTGNEPSTPVRGKKTSAVRSPGKAWSEEEKFQLFDLVIKHGASRKAFEGQIEGRTGNQCYMAWKTVLMPNLRRYIAGGSVVSVDHSATRPTSQRVNRTPLAMPRAEKSSSPSSSSNPYPSPHTSPSGKSTAKDSARRKSTPWTAEEKIKLFEVAIKHGASTRTFEGLIEGRSGKTCYDNWNKTIVPFIKGQLGSR